jgi:CubicO group peptidase (beta-lactamase class C family)
VDGIRTELEAAVTEGVFPGAVLLTAMKGRIVFYEAMGHRSMLPEWLSMEKDTIFDLASLTKPFATAMAMMRLVDKGQVELDQPLEDLLSGAFLGDKKDLTPRLLLTHSAGLVDWKPFYERLTDHPLEERKKLLREWVVREPYAYEPGKGSLYSDLGFMLLEWMIEKMVGESLDRFVHHHFYEPLGLKRTFFRPVPPLSPVAGGGKNGNKDRSLVVRDFAATEDCPWRKRVLQGEVHDENAFALGGVSGHAGLFSTAEEVWTLANMLREHYRGEREDFFRHETVREFFRRQDLVEGSDWALGWDTRALEGSSAGRYFSRDSVGHTGFTGTSVWMDLVKDVTAIFLTNRVHPTREGPEKMKSFRPKIHDAVMLELGLGKKGVLE